MELKEKIESQVRSLEEGHFLLPLTRLAKQESHQHCMLCGPNALLGMKLDFYRNAAEVWALTIGSIHQQGYEDILHGGFLAALLDAAMCQAVFNKNIEAVTADMKIRFLHEIPVNSELLIKGVVISNYSTLYKVEAEIYVKQQLMVKAEARFMKKKAKK